MRGHGILRKADAQNAMHQVLGTGYISIQPLDTQSVNKSGQLAV